MKNFNYIPIIVIGIMLVSSASAIFFLGGYTVKAVSLIIMCAAVALVSSGIYNKFFIKGKEQDERNIVKEWRPLILEMKNRQLF